MSCGVGGTCSLEPALLWLWCRPAATILIQPLAWELQYAVGAALKRQKNKKKKGRKIDFMPLGVNLTPLQTAGYHRSTSYHYSFAFSTIPCKQNHHGMYFFLSGFFHAAQCFEIHCNGGCIGSSVFYIAI